MHERELVSTFAYEELKAALLDGALAYGRLDIQRLADRFRVSPTPVREALARLAGERLIGFSAGHGYAAAPPPAHELRDLYVWSGELSALCLRHHPQNFVALEETLPAWAGARKTEANIYAHRVSRLMRHVGAVQTNREIIAMLAHANDRLFRARGCEARVDPTCALELAALERHWRDGAFDPFRAVIRQFHDSRAALAAAIAECLARNGRPSPSG